MRSIFDGTRVGSVLKSLIYSPSPATKSLILGLAFFGAFAVGSAVAAPAQPSGWKAVLIAGDNAEPAFGNAVDAMAKKLANFGVPRDDILELKATGSGPEAATKLNIAHAFEDLHPGPSQGCFVFVTSHGAPGRGLVLARSRGYLTPSDLGGLLDRACGARPTVVIASGCYSGSFAEGAALPAPNRIILTAARDDRPSFGCSADRKYTVFDQCVLDSLDRGVSWQKVMDRTQSCVAKDERAMHVERPSHPQLYMDPGNAGLRAFGAGD